MTLKDYLSNFNKPYQIIKSEYYKDFENYKSDQKERLGNLENKTHLLKDAILKSKIDDVIFKIKSPNYNFQNSDIESLKLFTSQINSIAKIADRINNFKEGTFLDNGKTLHLANLFNAVIKSKSFEELNLHLNSNLNSFLPHIYSIIKHCQYPTQYPVYYKFWKNIMREVLGRKDDYDEMCTLYRQLPDDERHLEFASYFGTIGLQIAKNIDKVEIPVKLTTLNRSKLTT